MLNYNKYLELSKRHDEITSKLQIEYFTWVVRCSGVVNALFKAQYNEDMQFTYHNIVDFEVNQPQNLITITYRLSTSPENTKTEDFTIPLDKFVSSDWEKYIFETYKATVPKTKPCPFCGSDNIGYSIKSKGKLFHASFYCKDCNAYGRRVLIHPTETRLSDIRRNEQYYLEALSAWNTRSK